MIMVNKCFDKVARLSNYRPTCIQIKSPIASAMTKYYLGKRKEKKFAKKMKLHVFL